MLIISVQGCQGEKKDIKISKLEQNYLSASDSITTFINEAGELQSEKALLIQSEKELKKSNRELYDKVKAQDGKVVTLTNTVFKLHQDINDLNDTINSLVTVSSPVEVLDSNTVLLPFELHYTWDKNNYDIFKGKTQVTYVNEQVTKHNTFLYYRESVIDLTFGTKVEDEQFKVFVTSKYPGLSINNTNSIMLDPNDNKDIKKLIRQKKWFNGFHLGPFIGSTVTGNVTTGGAIMYSIYKL